MKRSPNRSHRRLESLPWLLLVLAAIVVSGPIAEAKGDLARKGYLGLRVLPLVPANSERLGLPDTDGAWVQLLPGGSPAAEAGLMLDDVIVAVNEIPTPDLATFARVVEPLRAGEVIRLEVRRERGTAILTLEMPPFPLETLEEVTTEYDAFEAEKGIRLRALVSRADATGDSTLPAVLLIQGHAAESVEAGGYNAHRRITQHLATRGYMVMRFDRRGVGDSEGESYLDLDFRTEVDDTEAALRFLATRPGVDPTNIFILGSGLGGTVAAAVAERHPEVRGLLVAGSVGRPWVEYVLESARDHRRRADASPSEINAALDILSRFFVLLAEGVSMDEILDRHPDWREVVLDWQGRPYGRNPDYFAQLGSVNPVALYQRLECSVLVLYGESDFVAMRTDQDAIEAALLASGNPDHVLFVLPETDHAFAFASSRDESYENWMRGQVFFNRHAMDPIVSWLDRRSGKR